MPSRCRLLVELLNAAHAQSPPRRRRRCRAPAGSSSVEQVKGNLADPPSRLAHLVLRAVHRLELAGSNPCQDLLGSNTAASSDFPRREPHFHGSPPAGSPRRFARVEGLVLFSAARNSRRLSGVTTVRPPSLCVPRRTPRMPRPAHRKVVAGFTPSLAASSVSVTRSAGTMLSTNVLRGFAVWCALLTRQLSPRDAEFRQVAPTIVKDVAFIPRSPGM